MIYFPHLYVVISLGKTTTYYSAIIKPEEGCRVIWYDIGDAFTSVLNNILNVANYSGSIITANNSNYFIGVSTGHHLITYNSIIYELKSVLTKMEIKWENSVTLNIL